MPKPSGLNEQQQKAVLHTEGPLLIVAGAGAGKTKTITHRIAHLIEKGVPAHKILAVTFTNKAAGEMRERVRALLATAKTVRIADGSPDPSPSEGFRGMPLVCTFHALGVRLLREFHADARLPRGFVIWDRDDSIRSIKAVLEKLDSKQWVPRSMLSAISRQKGDGVDVHMYAESSKTYREKAVARVWEEYERALSADGALDFDDLLLRTLALLRGSERVRSLLQNRWSYITIDEYQDTNKSQYEIARILAGEKKNICVVGDTDQNIYSWRGADIEHLLGFEASFPGARVIVLEQNYRSTRTILAAANSVIEKNLRRRPKHLFTDNPTGEPIALYTAQNEIDEAWFVAQITQEAIGRGVSAGEIAVLYRENFQSRALEEAMLHFGIPYRVLGTKFFERKEVKDVLSYLRAAMNPQSGNDIARTVAVPPRGIGKVTVEKMLRGEDAALPAAARAKVAAFRESLVRIKHAIDTLPTSEAVRYAVEASGIGKMYEAKRSAKSDDEAQERLENIHELVNLATKYDHELPPSGIERLLEEAALQSDQDELPEEKSAVSLMTVHASKGLEFDAVFVTGLEQGLFPSLREGESSDRDPEEERRLLYVALTRARKQLFLTYASARMKYGSREYTLPSEFLEDIDQRLLTTINLSSSQEKEEEIQI